MLHLVQTYHEALVRGLWTTIELCVGAWILGTVIGALLGFLAIRWPRLVGLPCRVISVLLGATPILLALYWLYYPAPQLFGFEPNPWLITMLVLSLYMTFGVADAVSAALRDFPAQYVAAGRVSGLTKFQIVRHVQAPILVRQILPAYLAMMLLTLHSSLFGSFITVEEVFRTAQNINSREYQPIPVYSLVALVFLVVSLPLQMSATWFRRAFRDFSER